MIRRFLGRFLVHEAQHVIAAPIEAPSGNEAAGGFAVVESLQQLEAMAPEFPAGLSLDRLRRWLEPGRIAILARRPVGNGATSQVVGYRVCERGVLKSSLGLHERIAPAFLFIHYAEVLAEYRGQRIAELLRECSHRFAVRRGITWTCGVVGLGNAASLAAHLRPGSGSRVVTTIHKLSFFGGRIVWRTRWRTIATALDRLIAGQKTFEGRDLFLEDKSL